MDMRFRIIKPKAANVSNSTTIAKLAHKGVGDFGDMAPFIELIRTFLTNLCILLLFFIALPRRSQRKQPWQGCLFPPLAAIKRAHVTALPFIADVSAQLGKGKESSCQLPLLRSL